MFKYIVTNNANLSVRFITTLERAWRSSTIIVKKTDNRRADGWL